MSQSEIAFSEGVLSTASVSESESHQILSSERRQILLYVLDEQPTTVHLDTVASAVAKREANPTDTVESVAISLHHNHLPMLANAGIIHYNPESNLIVR